MQNGKKLFVNLFLLIVVGIFLWLSIYLLMLSIKNKSEDIKKQKEVLRREIDAPQYFQSRGLQTITPEILRSYDQQFHTKLYSQVSEHWQQPLAAQTILVTDLEQV